MFNRILICMLISLIMAFKDSCLKRCQCLLKGETEEADCTNRSFKSLPRKSHVIHTFLLSYNEFRRLEENMFSYYVELRTLKLDNCHIEHISPTAFDRLESLLLLDCSQNSISEFSPEIFKDTRQLRHVNFFKNNLTRIEDGLFTDLNGLVSVDLSTNRIEYLASDSFGSNPNLTTVYLHENRLKHLDVIRNVPVLKQINLYKNLLVCDNKLKAFVGWVNERSIETYAQCHKPDTLKNKHLSDISSTSLSGCSFQILKMSYDFYYASGIEHVNISCNIRTDISSGLKYFWILDNLDAADTRNKFIQGYKYVNSVIQQIYFKSSLDDIYTYKIITCVVSNGTYCKDSIYLLVEDVFRMSKMYFTSTTSTEPDRTVSTANTNEIDIEQYHESQANDSDQYSNGLWIGITVSCVGVLIVIIVSVVCLRRRNRNANGSNENSIVFQQMENDEMRQTLESEEEVNPIYGVRGRSIDK